LVLAGSLIGMRLWRRARPAVSSAAEEQVLHRLDALEPADLAPVELHERLSELVRSYLVKRWHLPALHETTAELLARHGQEVPLQARELLADFLQRCDLAKFAPVAPTTQQCQDVLALARCLLIACEEKGPAR
jgi:hypothetical protein